MKINTGKKYILVNDKNEVLAGKSYHVGFDSISYIEKYRKTVRTFSSFAQADAFAKRNFRNEGIKVIEVKITFNW